ncbi:MAG TPA: hypothetical protein PKD99_15230 [Sphingopyxis sp.]|nr:hypothetical protein [Sphingopyxis sp.]HMP46450.1 hypothetical protein [Sphingopyxis sp.]HMQ18646.1 hypothetical protein [Sphingopyxis sp.]
MLAVALAVAGVPVSAADETGPLAPLRFLSGACWIAAYPGGRLADLQCFEPMENGRFLRARHIVLGSDPAYSGETVYYADGATGRLLFIYFTSLGGVSRGTVVAEADGLVFPDQWHVAADGSGLRLHTVLTPLGTERYRIATRRWTGGAWSAPFAAEFRRLPGECATWEAARIRCGDVAAISAPG